MEHPISQWHWTSSAGCAWPAWKLQYSFENNQDVTLLGLRRCKLLPWIWPSFRNPTWKLCRICIVCRFSFHFDSTFLCGLEGPGGIRTFSFPEKKTNKGVRTRAMIYLSRSVHPYVLFLHFLLFCFRSGHFWKAAVLRSRKSTDTLFFSEENKVKTVRKAAKRRNVEYHWINLGKKLGKQYVAPWKKKVKVCIHHHEKLRKLFQFFWKRGERKRSRQAWRLFLCHGGVRKRIYAE